MQLHLSCILFQNLRVPDFFPSPLLVRKVSRKVVSTIRQGTPIFFLVFSIFDPIVIYIRPGTPDDKERFLMYGDLWNSSSRTLVFCISFSRMLGISSLSSNSSLKPGLLCLTYFNCWLTTITQKIKIMETVN